MKNLKYSDIETGNDDTFLYNWLIDVLKEIKLVQGGTDLAYTLRRHPKLKNYCVAKQKSRLDFLENTFFTDIGSLNTEAISSHNLKNRTLQNL